MCYNKPPRSYFILMEMGKYPVNFSSCKIRFFTKHFFNNSLVIHIQNFKIGSKGVEVSTWISFVQRSKKSVYCWIIFFRPVFCKVSPASRVVA